MTSKSILNTLHDELWEIPRKASRLPWADQKCWTFETHLWIESDGQNQMVVVDLHDLTVKLARDVVYKSMRSISSKVGAICFITGQGNHSSDGPRILPMTLEVVQQQAAKKNWEIQTRQGRVMVIFDADTVPEQVSGTLSKTMVYGIYLFFGLLFAILLRSLFTV